MGKFQNYELNEKQRQLQELRYKQRLELRAQFWKNMTHPNRHGSGEGGFMFDPAIMRFQAMKASHTDFFKPTGKAAFWGFSMVVLPITALYLAQLREREGRERKYRNGEVSYRDRQFKFV